MKKIVFRVSFLIVFTNSAFVWANDQHDHKSPPNHESHEHADEVEHDKEENPQVGPNKGIVAANKEQGFQLSAEAEKNFEIKKLKLAAATSLEIPKNAVVTAGLEVNLYRYRADFYKRIDFEQIGRTGNKILIRSKDLQSGDEIALTGLGFLRIAEIAAFDGAPEGHSH